MAVTRDQILEELRHDARALQPNALMAWDIQLTQAMSEHVGVLLEVFNIPAEGRRAFFRGMFRHLRNAEHRLGIFITMITHTPEASMQYYAHWVDRIKSASSGNERLEERADLVWRLDRMPQGRLVDIEPSESVLQHLRAA